MIRNGNSPDCRYVAGLIVLFSYRIKYLRDFLDLYLFSGSGIMDIFTFK